MCVKDDSRFQDLDDLMSTAVEAPDTVLFGMAPGTPAHFAGLRLEAAVEGATFRYVVSGGGSKRLHDLLGGHIDVSPFSLAEYARFKTSGLRALAYFGRERSPAEPDLPTAHEQGIPLEMTNVQYWWAPKGTPPAVTARLADAFEAAMQTDRVRKRLQELKIDPVVLRGETLAEDLAVRERDYEGVALVDYDRLPDVARAVGIVLATLVLLVLVQGIRGRAAAPSPSRSSSAAPFALLAAIGAYLCALQVLHVPFPWATTAAVPLLGFLCGARSRARLLKLTVLGGAVAWGCFLLFTRVLVTDLP